MKLFVRGDREKPPDEESVKEEWQVLQGERAGRRLIARFNAGARHLAGNSRYGIQIGVRSPAAARQQRSAAWA